MAPFSIILVGEFCVTIYRRRSAGSYHTQMELLFRRDLYLMND